MNDNEPFSPDAMIKAHLVTALKRIDARDFRRAQINIEYARNRLRDAVGELPVVLAVVND